MQCSVDPADRVTELPIAVQRPGERRLRGEIFPQLQVLICPFDSVGAVFHHISVVVNKVMVVMDLAPLRGLQIGV